MSFPPGLLPSLVKEHLRTEEKYQPLEKKDVISAGIPELEPIDAYLAARLEKFAAELRVRFSYCTEIILLDDLSLEKARCRVYRLRMLPLQKLTPPGNLILPFLQDYRSGTSRADLEEDEKRQKTRNNLGEKGTGRYGRTISEDKPKFEDGSFKGQNLYLACY